MPTRSLTRAVRVFRAERTEEHNCPCRELVQPEPAVAFEPLTVRIPTAMKLTGLGRSKLYELIASGDIEAVKVGTATLITMASLRRLVAGGAT